MIYDDTICALGEGAFWHPTRQQFFWFDILGKRLHTKGRRWQFVDFYSAAGWVDDDTLLIASAKGLHRFDIATGNQSLICPLEADNPVTRSNDGRADPQGGFWIGTMGINAEAGAGSIWRFYRGELRCLFDQMNITNAICFAPNGKYAYFVDTMIGKIMATDLDPQGWPTGTPRVHLDLSDIGYGVDGAIVDAAGNIWNAQWGAGRVAQYAPDGTLLQTVAMGGKHTSCPAFGGPDLTTLFCTTATEHMTTPAPDDGKTFAFQTDTTGQAEHRVIL